jgi:hypothetical protein
MNANFIVDSRLAGRVKLDAILLETERLSRLSRDTRTEMVRTAELARATVAGNLRRVPPCGERGLFANSP